MKICVGGGNGAEADLWVLIDGLISAFLQGTSSRRLYFCRCLSGLTQNESIS